MYQCIVLLGFDKCLKTHTGTIILNGKCFCIQVCKVGKILPTLKTCVKHLNARCKIDLIHKSKVMAVLKK